MESQNNNSESLFIFKCVSKREMIVFEIDTNDSKHEVSKLLANFRGGSAAGTSDDGPMSPGENTPALRRSRKTAKPKEDTKSVPAVKKQRPINPEQQLSDTDPAAGLPERNTFFCDHCNYKTKTKTRFNKHLTIHSTVESNLSETSELTDSMQSSWAYVGKKPYKCKKCDFRCIGKTDLKLHLFTHTGRKPLKCNKCNFICNIKIIMKTHLLTHTGEKPFSCDMCDYKCKYKSSLVHHFRTHTGEKPFSCDQCDFKCNQISNLKRHYLSHSDEKPFVCKRCNYRSSRKDNLKQHLLTHSGEKRFVCAKCEFRYCDKRALIKHMMKVHGISS